MKLIRLKVTPPHRGDGMFAQRTPRQIVAWLEELPKSNADVCAVTLLQALKALNETLLHKAERSEVMELLRPAVNDTCFILIERYKSASLPLSERQQAVADQVMQLCSELARGYRLAVNEHIERCASGDDKDKRPLQLVIQRALLCLGRALLESYRIYAPEPPHLWRDAHTLFHNAEITRIQGLPVESTQDSDETALSIKQAYLRIAVLALTNPYHLVQGEAEELYRRIGRWVHFVQIRAPGAGEALPGYFAADLSSDFPARYLPAGLKLPPLTTPRLLLLDRLVEALDQQIARSNEVLANTRLAATLSERVQRNMYIRFRDALGGRSERASERQSAVAKLTLAEGLSACHFILNGRRPFTPERDEAAWDKRLGRGTSDNGLKILRDDQLTYKPGTDSAGSRTSHFSITDFEEHDIWRKAASVGDGQAPERRARRSPYRANDWHRKNESAGGVALFCPQQCPAQVRVGDLVAYAEQDTVDAAAWRIGVIRWLRTRPNAGLELGIKHLAENGHAVGVKAMTGAGTGSEYLRGLLLPRVNPLTEGTTLVVPAAVYDVGTILRLNVKELSLYARLTDLIETTRQFSHYRFRLIEAPLTMMSDAELSLNESR